MVRQIAAHWVQRSMQRVIALGSSSCRQASAQLAHVVAQALAASIAARSCAGSKVSLLGWVLRMSIRRPYAVRAVRGTLAGPLICDDVGQVPVTG